MSCADCHIVLNAPRAALKIAEYAGAKDRRSGDFGICNDAGYGIRHCSSSWAAYGLPREKLHGVNDAGSMPVFCSCSMVSMRKPTYKRPAYLYMVLLVTRPSRHADVVCRSMLPSLKPCLLLHCRQDSPGRQGERKSS